MSKNKVLIFDTTLRDGEQSPGATMTHGEKLEIAEMLDDMGVDIIEAGFPIASEGDFAAVSEIARQSKDATICGLARANYKDIDRCWEAVKADLIRKLIATVPGAADVIFATHCHNDLGMATANSLAAVEGGARQVECTINGLGERAGNTALEEVVMALKVRHDIMPFTTDIDTTKIMNISRRVAAVSGFAVQFNKAIVGKNAFAHESGIHQDGMLKNRETFEVMRPEDVGLTGTSLPLGKHSGRAALRAKLEELGFTTGDNELKDVFVRFKELADRKKEVFDDDLIALMSSNAGEEDRLKLKSLRVVCGTDGPQQADMVLEVDGKLEDTTATGDGPVDATFNAVKAIFPHNARLQLYQVQAVTEGTDAQATVFVRMEEEGRIGTGQSADTDTVVASAKAYINALNRLLVRRETGGPGYDTKGVSYKDVS